MKIILLTACLFLATIPGQVAPLAVAAPAASKEFKIEETWNGTRTLNWSPEPDVRTPEHEAVAFIQVKEASKDSTLEAELPLSEIRGQTIRIETKIKAENVSNKPNDWNGIKVMLAITNTDGAKDFPQYDLSTGSFGWEPVSWKVSVPANATSVTLILGLEKVSGKIWIGPIKITRE